MAAYESDSSDGEFTETNVLLGYASRNTEEETISKLGGYPEWLESEKPPSASLARCRVCKDTMVLLLQLNGELPDRFPGHDRRLYVFACRKQTCRRKEGSIRAIRGLRVWKEEAIKATVDAPAAEEAKVQETETKAKGPGLGDALFGANPFSSGSANPFSAGGLNAASKSNPFASPTSSQSVEPTPAAQQPAAAATSADPPTSNLTKTFAESLSINAPSSKPPPPPEPWPDAASQPKPYPTLYLDEADYETLEPTSKSVPTNARVEDSDAPEPSILDREAFESTMDATFQKFADRMSQNPDQVIRYEFGGVPLPYSKTDKVGEILAKGAIPRCPNCGGRRTFEVQLTPNAIAELEADELSLEGMEWGTIILGVCESDCGPQHVGLDEAGYLEEWAGVQWEELTKRK